MHLCDDLLGLTLQCITYAMFVVVGEVIAAHQDGILRRSRQVQAFLYLPTCTHIFSEADTEIHDMKCSAVALSFTILIVSAVTLDMLIEGPMLALSRPRVACSVIALMVTPGLMLWLRLALTCRRRQRNRRAVAWDIEDINTDDLEIKRDESTNETTALLSLRKEPNASEEKKVQVGDDQSRQDGPSKKQVGTADKSSRRDGHKHANGLRVPWTESDFPVLVLG